MSQECCSTPQQKTSEKPKGNPHHHDHDHDHDLEEGFGIKIFLPALFSFVLLGIGIYLDYLLQPDWFQGWIRFVYYLIAYIPVGFPVIKEAWQSILHRDFFSEFLLMSIATVGAFAIKEYPEGVAVMLFYSVGELFQNIAVSKAKLNIKSLIDLRPEQVVIMENGIPKTLKASEAQIGQTLQLKPGEKLALDGELISERATFDTSALTGESVPQSRKQGETVLAGMINLNTVTLVKVNTAFEDSKLSKILELVQNATSQKAPTELFIRKFAKIYTPIVVFLAIGISVLPYFFIQDYHFKQWLYRALIFLVISCPCALVISIPLGYFGGIGAASRNGILFKGSNFLDVLSKVQNVMFDKTGTMTEGVFKVQKVVIPDEENKEELLQLLNVIESKSTHPIATAIHEFVGKIDHSLKIENLEEIPGHGLKATINGKNILAGNFKLLEKFGIQYPAETQHESETMIAIAVNEKFAGYLTISDQIKSDAQNAIQTLNNLGVKTTMLSGDKNSVVQEVAQKIGIQNAFGNLLPEDKVQKVKEIKSKGESVAFVGDGVNDAPVVAISDVGIAMGGLGSDATIETADVVMQDDRPSKIPMAIKISKETRKIVWQNIALAFGVKAIVLILGAGGIATMWEAVFADVGVALLAILNAIRIQHMNFRN